jgi:uncharacterized protein YndB with AHSA1/START domain
MSSEELRYEETLNIEASADSVWQAITSPAVVSQYFIVPLVQMDLTMGGDIVYGSAAKPLISGTVLALETNVTLVHTFIFTAIHPGVQSEDLSRVTYHLEEIEQGIALHFVHDHFGDDRATHDAIADGWPVILSRLKAQAEGRELPDFT